jgi:hypothetical protein
MSVRLLLSTQRSGSHFLKALIEARFPAVVCSGEVLEEPVAFSRQFPALAAAPEFPHFWLWYELAAAARSISVAPDRRIEAFDAYLSKLQALVKPKDVLVDVKYNTLRALGGYWDTEHGSSDFTTYVTSRHIPVLHLIRKNILRVLISEKMARQSGVRFRMKDAVSDVLPAKVRLNPKTVLAEIQAIHALTHDYRNHFEGHPGYQEIIYEDVVREREFTHTGAHLRTLGHFFSRKPNGTSQPAIPFKKIAPEDPADAVENWDEVVRALQCTEHGWMAQARLLAAA